MQHNPLQTKKEKSRNKNYNDSQFFSLFSSLRNRGVASSSYEDFLRDATIIIIMIILIIKIMIHRRHNHRRHKTILKADAISPSLLPEPEAHGAADADNEGLAELDFFLSVVVFR
jgi:hypothetical protein